MSIRVCIADDHQLLLTGVRRALENAADIEIVGATHRGDEVVGLVEQQRPDVVLLDHEMPGIDAPACLTLMKQRHPGIKVVILSASERPAQIAEVLAAGADAYIGKRIDPADLASALRQLVAGVVYLAGPNVPSEQEAAVETDLTPRELTMLDAISRGLSTKAISRELWVSEKTVKFHLTNIYRKLGVHNRTGAMRYAFEHNLAPVAETAVAAAAAG